MKNIKPGSNPPEDINVIIEISSNNKPVKYEYDKVYNILVVDRFMSTTMQYPCNYGFIPNTISGDGDPIDVLVLSPTSLIPGTMINCRPIGLLKMHDESGNDDKILSVPNKNLTKIYDNIQDTKDLPDLICRQISYFFKHYKDLDSPDKWVKIKGFKSRNDAKETITNGINKYKNIKHNNY